MVLMFSVDWWLGCVWTLIAMCLGIIVGGLLVLLLSDREPPGPDIEDPDPEPDPLDWLEAWFEDPVTTISPETDR